MHQALFEVPKIQMGLKETKLPALEEFTPTVGHSQQTR